MSFPTKTSYYRQCIYIGNNALSRFGFTVPSASKLENIKLMLYADNSSLPSEQSDSKTSFPPSFYFTGNELCLVTTALLFISVIGAFQNFMVVAAVFLSTNRLLEIPSSSFVLSLASADFLVCGVSVPMYLVHLYQSAWQPFLAFGQFTTLISGGSLLLLTFNRFLSIYDTFGYMKKMTVRRAQLLAIGVWLLATGLTITSRLEKFYDADYLVFVSIVYYVTINVLTGVFHLYMFRISWAKTRAIRCQRLAFLSGQQRNALREYNHLFRLLLIVATYVITWVPFSATLSATPADEERQSKPFQRRFALFYTLLSMNSTIDPFLYFLRSQEFKMFTEQFSRIFRGRKRRVQPGIESSTVERAASVYIKHCS